MKFERIVQITDTHIVENYHESVLSWDPIAALEIVLDSINSLPTAPNLVIATGDLVHDATESNYLTLKRILRKIRFPVLAIPGNHDSSEDLESFLVEGNIEMVEYKELEHANWAIVFLDSVVRGEEHGNVSEDAIARIEYLYSSLNRENVLLGLHHSPTPGCLGPFCQLHGKERLFDFLTKYNKTKAVVSGHTHCQMESEYGGVKLLTTPSTLFQVRHSQTTEPKESDKFMDFHKFDGTKKGYRIIDLFEDGSIQSEVSWV